MGLGVCNEIVVRRKCSALNFGVMGKNRIDVFRSPNADTLVVGIGDLTFKPKLFC